MMMHDDGDDDDDDDDDDDENNDDYDDEDEATKCIPLHSKCCVKQLQSQLAPPVATNTFSCHDDDDLKWENFLMCYFYAFPSQK